MNPIRCSSASSNFTVSCIPGGDGNGFDLARAVNNTQNGVCSTLLDQIFSSCPFDSFSYMFGLDSNCYKSEKAFLTCLPGASSRYTKKPSTCNWLSHMVFFTNEASTLLPISQKLVAIAATYLLRILEVKTCLAECPVESYTVLGPKEYPIETSRYAKSMTERSLQVIGHVIDMGLAVWSPPKFLLSQALKMGFHYAMGPHLYVDQFLDAPLQQQARNLDFKMRYAVCQEYARAKEAEVNPLPPEIEVEEEIKATASEAIKGTASQARKAGDPELLMESNSEELVIEEGGVFAKAYAQSFKFASSAKEAFTQTFPINMDSLKESLSQITNNTIRTISEVKQHLSPQLLIKDDEYKGEDSQRPIVASFSERDLKVLLDRSNRIHNVFETTINQEQLGEAYRIAEAEILETFEVFAEIFSDSTPPCSF